WIGPIQMSLEMSLWIQKPAAFTAAFEHGECEPIYNWAFPDTTINKPAPFYAFKDAGEYDVTLEVTCNTCSSSAKTHVNVACPTIEIKAKPDTRILCSKCAMAFSAKTEPQYDDV